MTFRARARLSVGYLFEDLIRDCGLRGTPDRLLRYLYLHASLVVGGNTTIGQNRPVVWHGEKAMADVLGVSTRTIQRALAALQIRPEQLSKQLVAILQVVHPGARHRSNLYLLAPYAEVGLLRQDPVQKITLVLNGDADPFEMVWTRAQVVLKPDSTRGREVAREQFDDELLAARIDPQTRTELLQAVDREYQFVVVVKNSLPSETWRPQLWVTISTDIRDRHLQGKPIVPRRVLDWERSQSIGPADETASA